MGHLWENGAHLEVTLEKYGSQLKQKRVQTCENVRDLKKNETQLEKSGSNLEKWVRLRKIGKS